MPNVTRLSELFVYCPQSGMLLRRINRGRGKAGDPVGTMHTAGYLQVRVDGKWEYVHRIAFALMTGTYPTHEIDHKNGKPSDNRWTNLRPATRAENAQNSKQRCHSSNPFKGVRRSPTEGKWIARIVVDSQEKYLGTFDSAEAARAAYKRAAKHHQPFNTMR